MSVWNRKSILLGFMFLGILSWSFGQVIPPKPNVCTTPPAGYLQGGRLSFSTTSCIPETQTTMAVQITNTRDPNIGNVTLDNPKIFFNVDNSFDINTAGSGIPMAGNNGTATSSEGVFWVMLTGTKGANKYAACTYIEVLQRKAPSVQVNACTGNLMTLTIDATNHHEIFRIKWPDGVEEVINTATTPLPVSKTKAVVSGVPSVRGEYFRNGGVSCESAYFEPKLNGSSSPYIHTLIGDDLGKAANISFGRFEVGKTYDIMGRIDNGNISEPWKKLGEGLNGKATLTGLDPNLRYCFQTRTKNSCGNDVFSENMLCSIKITGDVISASEAEIKWNLPTEPNLVPKLKLYRDEEGCASCQQNPPLSSNTVTKYDAKNLECSKTYLFTVQTTYPPVSIEGTPTQILVRSAQIKVNPKSNAVAKKPNDLVYVGFDPSDELKIQLLIADYRNPADGYKYTFYRAENNSNNFLKLGERTESKFEDVAISPDPKSYCYKYTIEDNCGITSLMSDPFCTILLGSKNQGILNWTPFLTPPDVYNSASPVEYSVEYFDEKFSAYVLYQTTGTLQESIQKILSEATTSEVKFRVMGYQMVDTDIATNQRIFSYSNTFIVKVMPGMFIPTAFTPNGEGPADSETFKINTKFVQEGNIKIFDRWGGTMFDGNALTDAWNGTEANGITPAPPGNYLYVIKAVSDTGLEFTMKGTVLLLR
jgi:gliding motility-associated-like protein